MGAFKIYDSLIKGKERGMHNYWVFDVETFILSNPDFDSKHYAPLVHEPIPDLKRGTIVYDDFWDEQDRRCIEGYAPVVDGVQYPRITGPHYFYLNMYQIMMLKFGESRKTLDYPYYRTLDHMLFLEIERAQRLGYGLIIGKARRMGLSYIGSCMVLWTMLFHKDDTVAVGAGKEDKAKGLFDKVIKSLQNLREEYKVSYKKTKDTLKLCRSVTENKTPIDKGINSSLDVRTFFSDPSAFEGESYSYFIFEEIGLHEKLIKAYKASEPCFMEGEMQFGLPMLYGTGGDVDKGSRDFKIIWKDPAAYNMKKIFVPAYMYYPGRPPSEKDTEMDQLDAGVNFFDIRTGMTDKEAALQHILMRREVAKKSKDGFIKEVQSRPTEESHLFIKTDGGVLDRLKLSAQRERLFNGEINRKFLQGDYEWIDSEETKLKLLRARDTKEKAKIRIANKSKVRFIEDDEGPVWHLEGIKKVNSDELPYKVDIGGADSYDDENMVLEKGSLGATMGYRVFSGVSNEYDLPIALVHERGDGTSEDTYFERSLMMAIYWDLEILFEYTKFAIQTWFKDVNAYRYIRVKPNINRDIVVDNAKQEYGFKMTSGAKGYKALVTKLLKMEVKDNSQNIYLDKILADLIDYGDENTDIAMAYGAVLVHKLDIFDYITEDLEDDYMEEGDILLDMVYYTTDRNGKVVISNYAEDKKRNSLGASGIEVFDPRKHLDGADRENYLNLVARKKKIREDVVKQQQEAYVEEGVDVLADAARKFRKEK